LESSPSQRDTNTCQIDQFDERNFLRGLKRKQSAEDYESHPEAIVDKKPAHQKQEKRSKSKDWHENDCGNRK
jgi:hypothetical protein